MSMATPLFSICYATYPHITQTKRRVAVAVKQVDLGGEHP